MKKDVAWFFLLYSWIIISVTVLSRILYHSSERKGKKPINIVNHQQLVYYLYISKSIAIIVQSTLCKLCFTLRGQTKVQKGKTKYLGVLWRIFEFFEFNLFLRCVGCLILGQSTFTREMIFLMSNECQSHKPLNYKGHCEKSMGFSQRWRSRYIIL